jgi:hypothetical protein
VPALGRRTRRHHHLPGHTPVVTDGTEVIEFSPTEELGRTMEILGANLAAAAVAPA